MEPCISPADIRHAQEAFTKGQSVTIPVVWHAKKELQFLYRGVTQGEMEAQASMQTVFSLTAQPPAPEPMPIVLASVSNPVSQYFNHVHQRAMAPLSKRVVSAIAARHTIVIAPAIAKKSLEVENLEFRRLQPRDNVSVFPIETIEEYFAIKKTLCDAEERRPGSVPPVFVASNRHLTKLPDFEIGSDGRKLVGQLFQGGSKMLQKTRNTVVDLPPRLFQFFRDIEVAPEFVNDFQKSSDENFDNAESGYVIFTGKPVVLVERQGRKLMLQVNLKTRHNMMAYDLGYDLQAQREARAAANAIAVMGKTDQASFDELEKARRRFESGNGDVLARITINVGRNAMYKLGLVLDDGKSGLNPRLQKYTDTAGPALLAD